MTDVRIYAYKGSERRTRIRRPGESIRRVVRELFSGGRPRLNSSLTGDKDDKMREDGRRRIEWALGMRRCCDVYPSVER